mmetsp:Transcript_26647/g.41706  ORF Transcript_26647/g.41706 Transcript_26647/m.41706 type:complete len:130 (-) Transcript_26647:1257-1646(-)
MSASSLTWRPDLTRKRKLLHLKNRQKRDAQVLRAQTRFMESARDDYLRRQHANSRVSNHHTAHPCSMESDSPLSLPTQRQGSIVHIARGSSVGSEQGNTLCPGPESPSAVLSLQPSSPHGRMSSVAFGW